MPLDAGKAKDVVKASIRKTGGLPTSSPIEMQHKLSDLLITTEPQVSQLRVRISEGVGRLKPPHSLDVGHLSPVSKGSTVVSVIGIVAQKSNPVAAKASAKQTAKPKAVTKKKGKKK